MNPIDLRLSNETIFVILLSASACARFLPRSSSERPIHVPNTVRIFPTGNQPAWPDQGLFLFLSFRAIPDNAEYTLVGKNHLGWLLHSSGIILAENMFFTPHELSCDLISIPLDPDYK